MDIDRYVNDELLKGFVERNNGKPTSGANLVKSTIADKLSDATTIEKSLSSTYNRVRNGKLEVVRNSRIGNESGNTTIVNDIAAAVHGWLKDRHEINSKNAEEFIAFWKEKYK